MTRPRSELIAPETTPYYHVISRCVRRAFLCGEDRYTGQNFDHRKAWIIERIHYLERVFAIDIAAYAVMSNHYHLVLHINVQEAQDLSDQQVIQRWHHLYKGNLLTHRYLKNDSMTEAEIAKAQELITTWRERLSSISWFMRNLNEYVAREANKEDNCKGRFWESRFKSQALLDEQALAAAMAYVDLNPLRSGIAKTPETSDYTSIQARLDALNKQQATAPCLHPFIGNLSTRQQDGIPFRLIDYIELVDWTARQLKEDKVSLSEKVPPILKRLNVNQLKWLEACKKLERRRNTLVGCSQNAMLAKGTLNRLRINLFKLDG